jgi:hypothetical protein
MGEFSRLDLQAQPLDETGLCTLEIIERGASHHASWPPIRHTENDRPTTLVRERCAVLRQFLEVEAAPSLLELQVLVLASGEPFAKLLESGSHGPSMDSTGADSEDECAIRFRGRSLLDF